MIARGKRTLVALGVPLDPDKSGSEEFDPIVRRKTC